MSNPPERPLLVTVFCTQAWLTPHWLVLSQGAAQVLLKQTRLSQSLSAAQATPVASLPVLGIHTDSSEVPAAFATIAQVVPVWQSSFEVHAGGGSGAQI